MTILTPRRGFGAAILLAPLLAVVLLTGWPPLAAVEVPTPTVAAPALAAEHALFAGVLARVVKPDGVDYAALHADHADLDRYRAQLASASEPSDRAEKLAFYINAYNALTLALVIDQLPKDQADWPAWSIRKAGSTFTNVWKRFTFEVAGQRLTLDAIEHQILRPLGEPRIHFAINCASGSCPPLIAEPFRAATLEAQLEQVATAFARSDYHVRLIDGQLRLNPILDWFGEDFTSAGGVRAFLRARVSDAAVAKVLAGDSRLRFFDYDWTLNLHRPAADE